MDPTSTTARLATWGMLLLLSVAPAAAQEQVLIEAGSPMTYLANETDPGIGMTWTGVTEPVGWDAGTYGVGFDNSGAADALLNTVVPNTTHSLYSRASFNIPDCSAYSRAPTTTMALWPGSTASKSTALRKCAVGL
jgi:hypothetical protein